MPKNTIGGYAGKFLRVDLTARQIKENFFDEATLRKFIGGTGIGIKLLYEEVPPSVECFDSKNRIIIGQGPLGASSVGGSGSISVVTKGPMTNGATSTQANGFFGAFLKLAGFDGVILEGASDSLLYLNIEDGKAELRDAEWLSGRDTYDTGDLVRHEIGKDEKEASVLSIGPAGENLVRFAGIFVDKGHSASHNGVGAVMGSKKLKAIVATRGKTPVYFKDREKLAEFSRQFLENVKTQAAGLYQCGTLNGIVGGTPRGTIPLKNYTTNVWDIEKEKLEKFGCQYLRDNYSVRRNNCWGCSLHHCDIFKISEGPYQGEIVEEPEYEQFAALGPAIGLKDAAAVIMLSKEVDRLGIDTNESGWLIGFIMECYEKGVLSKEDLNGIEMRFCP